MLGAFFVFFVKSFLKLGPVEAVNLMSVFFSTGSLAALYILIKRILDKNTALVCTLLFSISPICLANSVYGNTHTVALLFLLAGMIFLVKEKDTLSAFGLVTGNRDGYGRFRLFERRRAFSPDLTGTSLHAYHSRDGPPG